MRNLSFLFVALFLLQLTTFAQTKWFKYAGNPVLDVGLPGSWEPWRVNHHDVYFDGTTYKMWYTGETPEPQRNFLIGLATSTDGITWDKDTSNPVLIPDPGAWDSEDVGTPVVIFDDNIYKMWYWGGTLSGVSTGIGYATSPDGITWTKYENNPVMNKGSGWEGSHVIPNSVILDGTIYKMWYAGFTGWTIRIGYATSPDGITWTKHGDPVLPLGPPGSWDQGQVYTADVHFDGTLYQMWYMGNDGNGGSGTYRIGYATSSDGINWDKDTSNPILDRGESGDWDGAGMTHPRVIFDGTVYHMWFAGDNGGNARIGYAQDFSNLVHADSVIIEETYVKPNTDPVNILGRVISPEGHALTAKAIILSDDGSIQDSVELFDDGLNGDGTADDGIYGGYLPVTNANEINYSAGIKTVDLVTGFTRNGLNWNITDRFTTIGPVVFKDYVITSNDTVPNPGDQISFKLELLNNGLTATAVDIKAVISTTDSSISDITGNSTIFGDIPAGQSVIPPSGFQQYTVKINPNSPGNKDVWFNVDIYSEDNLFWSDSFAFHIDSTVTAITDERNSLPDKYALHQNYPNPFNPSTTIRFSVPVNSNVTLTIYNSLGQEVTTIVNEEISAGNYSVIWNGTDKNGLQVSSGVYLYKMQANGNNGTPYSESKKMILLK